jgi:hypothetical protein
MHSYLVYLTLNNIFSVASDYIFGSKFTQSQRRPLTYHQSPGFRNEATHQIVHGGVGSTLYELGFAILNRRLAFTSKPTEVHLAMGNLCGAEKLKRRFLVKIAISYNTDGLLQSRRKVEEKKSDVNRFLLSGTENFHHLFCVAFAT